MNKRNSHTYSQNNDRKEKVIMMIQGHYTGSTYGCCYSIRFSEIVIVVKIIWEDDFFTYNKQEIDGRLNGGVGVSKEMKLAVYQVIEKTNYLFYLSHIESEDQNESK